MKEIGCTGQTDTARAHQLPTNQGRNRQACNSTTRNACRTLGTSLGCCRNATN